MIRDDNSNHCDRSCPFYGQKIAKFLIRKDKENHFVETRDYPGSRGPFWKYLACSQTVYFLLKVHRARVIKIETVEIKVARPSVFVGTPSIFESLRLKQIYLYCKTIITHVLHIDKH